MGNDEEVRSQVSPTGMRMTRADRAALAEALRRPSGASFCSSEPAVSSPSTEFEQLRERWDREIKRWSEGADRPTDPLFAEWQRTYRGRGRCEVDLNAMPEPWIGEPTAAPGLVLMGLNPGPVKDEFQHRDGIFPQAIAARFDGHWSSWARSSPYLTGEWPARVRRPNGFWRGATAFVSGWVGGAVAAEAVVSFELYPWHSARWDSRAFSGADEIVQEAIIKPIQSLGVRWGIGKGKAWWDLLERLSGQSGWQRLGGLGGPGESPCPSGVTHRRWLVVQSPTGLCVAAMKLKSMPVWPRESLVPAIRSALEHLVARR
jgi:hypothetical protein